MNWLQRIAQIPGSSLKSQVLWYHGTDNFTAYSLMENMLLKPRSETGNTSYTGSLSSIPSAVYLTNSVGKAAKHALDRCKQTKGHPVILVIDPKDLGMVHVDEDFVHMLLNGVYNENWHPPKKIIKEIFEMADDSTHASDYYPELSVQNAVLKYFRDKQEGFAGDENIEDEYLQEEGIVPDASGLYEYDESMHVAKWIASALEDKYQQEAIMNFQSMAHMGQVRAREVYLIPFYINIAEDPNDEYMVNATYMKSYEDLQRFGQRLDPRQLLMEFIK